MNPKLIIAVLVISCVLSSACVTPTSQLTPAVGLSATSLPAMPTTSVTVQPTHVPQFKLPDSTSHLLLDSQDFVRINTWAAQFDWARDARATLIANADAYPSEYLKSYNLVAPDLPLSGGQWGLWYICPDGLRLQYQRAHTPPHYCPSTKEYLASPPQWKDRPTLYDEVIYARRHDDLSNYARANALAYSLTGEKKYADNAASILRAYAEKYQTYPLHDKDGKNTKSGGRVHAQTLDEAIWLVDIAWSYDLVRDTLSSSDRINIEQNLLRQAVATIERNNSGMSNWQTWHNAAIAAVGFTLNDPTMISFAYDDRDNGFFAQLKQGADMDGFWWEGSWGYHFFALEPMLYLAEMGSRAGKDTWSQPNLRAMLAAPLQMAQPDDRLPSFNDDGGTTLSSGSRDWFYEIGYNHYHDPIFIQGITGKKRGWQGLLWGMESLPKGDAASLTSALLSKAGYAILRAGNANDLRYLVFKFAPHGGGHGHYDELNYVSFALGKTMAFDPGTHSYAAASHTGWDKTTVAHNTIVVDEQTQKEATGSLRTFVGLPAFSLASAETTDAYPKVVSITRTVALTSDYWIDISRASALDGKAHRLDWVYHNPGTLMTPLMLAPYTAFPKTNGYDYLTNPRTVTTNADWQATWDVSGTNANYASIYKNNDAISASFTITRTANNFAGQVDYDFANVADGYLFASSKMLEVPRETPTQFDLRVFGDGSNNRLALRVMDATGEKFVKSLNPISWNGWQTIIVPIDKSWSHSAGNDDGVMDLPVSQVAVQINRTATKSGRVLIDDLALTFPSAGRLIVEDFENASAQLQVSVLGANNTAIVVGNGIDQDNQSIPFIMARRNMKETTFGAVFEPYRTAPRITDMQMPSLNVAHIFARGVFDDWILLPDTNRAERAFGVFTTDATSAYVRQDSTNTVQTIAVAETTKIMTNNRVLLSASKPLTAQIVFAEDAIAITTSDVISQLRVYAPKVARVTLNGKSIGYKKDSDYIVLP